MESPTKKIKEEPIFDELPIMRNTMEHKNQRKRPKSNNYDQPQRPKSNNSAHERQRDNIDFFKSEFNVPDDYSRNKDQNCSKAQKKMVRQGKKIIFLFDF